MAEPARRLDDPDDKRVYDKSGTEPSDPRGHLRSLESGTKTDKDNPGGLKMSDLADKENQPGTEHEQQVGGGYKPKGSGVESAFTSRFMPFVYKKRNIATGGVVAAIISLFIFFFFALIPLKIEHIVKNLQNRFFATSENALQNQTEKMLDKYIVNHVLPSYKSCGTTVSKNCSVNITGNNPVNNLYRSWANGRLENKLAENYGLEFQKRADGWYVKSPTISGNGDNIGPNGEKLDSEFQRADRKGLRQSVGAAMESETKWKQVYYRFKVGRLLEEKYGIKRCIIFCSLTDPLREKSDARKLAAKIYITERVIVPRNQTLGIVLLCLFKNCAADATQPTEAVPGDNGALNGTAENPETDTAIREGLDKLALTFGASNVDELVALYKEISEKGFQNYLIEKALTPIIGETASGKLSDGIPVAGWIDFTARLINAANDSSHNLKKLSYLTNSTAAVSLFSMYRTYADEIHSGNVTADEVGSMVDSLSPGNHGDPNDPLLGGTVGAEGTPLYSYYFDSSYKPNTSSASVLSSLLGGHALAADSSGNDNTYKCNDFNPVPAGQLVCNEEFLGQGNHYADLVHEFLNMPGINILIKIAQIWRDSVGQLFDLANSIFGSVFQAAIKPLEAACKASSLPIIGGVVNYAIPYCEAKDLAQKYAPALMDALTKWLIPDPFSTNMSGGRIFDMMAAGADVAGNDSAHTTLGGQVLSDQQTADIINQRFQDDKDQFDKEPVASRLFNTDNQFSMVSRLAMAMPLDYKASAKSTLTSLMNNPFKNTWSAISSMFSNHAFAAAPFGDPFGVTQYGYPEGTIPDDPETYWDQNCSNNASFAYRKTNDWNIEASLPGNIDPDTQMPTNKTVNPCLLIKATVGSDGAVYDSNLLTADDLSSPGAGGTGDSTSGSTSTNTAPSGDAQSIAKDILQAAKAGRIKFNVLDSRDIADGSTPEQNIQETAEGKPANTTTTCTSAERGAQPPTSSVNLDASLLKFILELSNGQILQINALAGQCHGETTSNHYLGKAVDFGCPLDTLKADSVGSKYNISDQTGETCSNSGHYHYSIGGH